MSRRAVWTLGLTALMASPMARGEDSITPVVVIPSLERLEAGLKGCGVKNVTLPSAWLKSLGLLEVVNPREPVTIEAGDLVDKVYVRDVLEPWWQRIVIHLPVRPGADVVAALPQNADFGAHEVRAADRTWFVGGTEDRLMVAPAKRVVQTNGVDGVPSDVSRSGLLARLAGVPESLATADLILTGGAGTLRNAIGWWSVRDREVPTWIHNLTNDIDDHYLTVKFGKDTTRLDLTMTFIETTPLSKVTTGSQSAVQLLDWLPAGDFVALASVDTDSPGLRTLSGRILELLGDNDTSPLATALRMMREPAAITAVTYTPQVDPSNVGWISGTLIHWNARASARPDDTLAHFRTMVGTWGLLTADETDGSSWSEGALGLVSTPVDTWEVWPRSGLARSAASAQLYGPAPGARGMAALRESKGWITLGQHQGNLAESLRPTGPRGSLAEDPRISAANASLPSDCAARLFIDPAPLLPMLQRRFPETPLSLPERVPLIAVGLRFDHARLELSVITPSSLVGVLDQLYPELRRAWARP